jgi:hypothetical protein
MRSIAVNRALSATSKTAAAALALCMLAGNAWAAASCARPQDVKALQAAALQQQLMVAALTCNDTTDYNRFVTSYQGELQKSDRALMGFFLRQDAAKGARDYDTYKTKLANAASLRSQHDPQFCRSAKVAFDVAFERKGSLAELASERPAPIATGYASCTPSAPEMVMADATPRLPARHQALPDSLPSAPVITPDLASRPDRALPPVSQQREPYERDAYNRDADTRYADNRYGDERNEFGRDGTEARDDADAGNYAPRYTPRYADAPPPRFYNRGDEGYGDNAGDNSGYRDGADNGPTANNAGADAYNAPYAYRPYAYRPYAYRPYAYRPYAYGPPARPRLVRGPYGRWYLLLPYGR